MNFLMSRFYGLFKPLNSNSFSLKEVAYNNIVISATGYEEISKPSGAVFAIIADFGNVSTKDAINIVVGHNDVAYLLGTAGATVTQLYVLYFLKK